MDLIGFEYQPFPPPKQLHPLPIQRACQDETLPKFDALLRAGEHDLCHLMAQQIFAKKYLTQMIKDPSLLLPFSSKYLP